MAGIEYSKLFNEKALPLGGNSGNFNGLFERIYNILSRNDAEDIDKWFLSYLALTMASRAGLIKWDKDYGMLFENEKLSKLYPGYYDARFMPNPIGAWVIFGEWNDNAVCESISQQCTNKSKAAEVQVRNSRIDYLEESVAIEGMRKVLPFAYEGALTLNEYVYFILNSKLIRDYNLMTIDIDWDKVKRGIRTRIEDNVNNRAIWEHFKEGLVIEDGYSDEEKEAYKIIEETRTSMYAMYEANRREYIQLFTDSPAEAFMLLHDRRYNCFDKEMAIATARGFEQVDNPTKGWFPEYFEKFWKDYKRSTDINEEGIKTSINGFIALKEFLQKLATEKYNNDPFKKRFTYAFIDTIDKLLKQ